MSLVVRTWNLYHGRTHPQSRRTHLRRMVELVTEDGPDVVALQEVPLWALGRLERWSGMAVRWAVTVPALLLTPLARAVTALHPRVRSLVSGQANALLVAPRLELGEQRLLLLTPGVTRWEWLFRRGLQQRYCQAVEVSAAGRSLVVANLHATNADPRRAAGEVERAAAFVAGVERAVLLGDFNAPRFAPAGFAGAIDGLDQILVRGLELERGPEAWPAERRRLGGALLSDHAPVEAVIA